jgi:lipoprotein NlpI
MRATPDMHAHYVYGRGVAALRLGRASDAQSDIAGALSLDPSIAETFAGYGITP